MHVWQGLELVLQLSYICTTDNIYSLTTSEIYSSRGLESGLIVVAVECMQCIGLAPIPYYTASDCLSSQMLCVLLKMPGLVSPNCRVLLIVILMSECL